MQFYDKHILPWLTHKICSLSPARQQREKVVPFAKGRILEIGVGSGLNLPFYNRDKVSHLYGLDPSPEMWAQSRIDQQKLGFPFELLQAVAEAIPLEQNSIDSIVMTYTLCSIPAVSAALAEMRRVLKPDGRLFFTEHGLAPDENIRRRQNRFNPLWNKFSGGCNLNRNIPGLLQENNFNFEKLESMYIPGWKFASFNYWGVAK